MLYYATEYLRLSYTNDKTNKSDSIANQRKYIDEFVKRNPDIRIVDYSTLMAPPIVKKAPPNI